MCNRPKQSSDRIHISASSQAPHSYQPHSSDFLVSADQNGFYKRKNLKIIHYDHLPLADGVFAEAVLSNGKDMVDEQAIFRIDLNRFLEKLSHTERISIQSKAVDELFETGIKKRLGITFDTLKAMKVNIRKQIQLSFAG